MREQYQDPHLLLFVFSCFITGHGQKLRSRLNVLFKIYHLVCLEISIFTLTECINCIPEPLRSMTRQMSSGARTISTSTHKESYAVEWDHGLC